MALHRRLCLALFELWDSHDASEQATEEWARVSGGMEAIDRSGFADALFHLADAWVVGFDAVGIVEPYVAFLYDLFQHVASGAPPDACCWRAEEAISFAGYRRGEFTPSWGAIDALRARNGERSPRRRGGGRFGGVPVPQSEHVHERDLDGDDASLVITLNAPTIAAASHHRSGLGARAWRRMVALDPMFTPRTARGARDH